MISIDKDVRKMQLVIRIDRDDAIRAGTCQDEYNALICRISKLIYEEMRRTK